LDTLQQCALQKKKKVMFASEMNSNIIPESSTGDQEMEEAEIEEFEEERLQASELPLCVVHRMLSSQATPTAHLEEEWRRTNIFQEEEEMSLSLVK
jgi:hypothetical protein